MDSDLPHTLAVLCYLFDTEGRLLLLHRVKPPNRDRYSPIGGKVEIARGESPTDCAIREIYEEAGVTVTADDLHLTGIVSEAGYESGHFLMFLYEVTRSIDPAELGHAEFDEGRLEWHPPEALETLAIPETDRLAIWPAFQDHRGGFFALHLDCAGQEMTWALQQSSRHNNLLTG